MQYRKASKAEAKAIRETADPEWKRLLREGETLIMDKRPNWSVHDEMMLRSKKVGDEVAVWLEKKRSMAYDDAGATEPVFDGEDEDGPDLDGIEPQEPTEEDEEDEGSDLTAEAAKVFASV